MTDDMTKVIAPTSDQLNADDLISGSMTIKITRVNIAETGEQKVSVFFEGDNGKPFKPCKSMSRVMVKLWGKHACNYVGKSMTLYRDPKVKWGGEEVGGIRISHMSDIEGATEIALTVTRGSKKPFKVKPLASTAAQTTAPESAAPVDVAALMQEGNEAAARGTAVLQAFWARLKKPQQNPLLEQLPVWKNTASLVDSTPPEGEPLPPESEQLSKLFGAG